MTEHNMLRFDVINRVLFNHRILFLEPLAAQSLCCFIMTNHNHKKIAPCGMIKVFWIELKNYSMLRFDIINRVLFNHRILFLERWQSLCCFIMTNYSMLCFVIINSVLFNPLYVWIARTQYSLVLLVGGRWGGVSVPQIKRWGSSNVWWEGSVCSRFPTPVCTASCTRHSGRAVHCDLGDFMCLSVMWWRLYLL